jgi:hypothetical protein
VSSGETAETAERRGGRLVWLVARDRCSGVLVSVRECRPGEQFEESGSDVIARGVDWEVKASAELDYARCVERLVASK